MMQAQGFGSIISDAVSDDMAHDVSNWLPRSVSEPVSGFRKLNHAVATAGWGFLGPAWGLDALAAGGYVEGLVGGGVKLDIPGDAWEASLKVDGGLEEAASQADPGCQGSGAKSGGNFMLVGR